MASLKQIEANRQNSSKSTGPKTHEGKSVAKLNAIKHGLTSQTVVIGREDPDEFDELRSDLEQALEPVGRLESDLVETIAICMWRRCRVYQMEANILAYQQAEKEFSLAVNDQIACEKELDQHYAEIELALNSDEDLEDETENEDENESWENIVDNETYKMLQEEEKKCESLMHMVPAGSTFCR